MRPRALFLVPADYDALRRKGTDRMITERDEDGFFERVVTVHPLALQARRIDLSAVHTIYEFSLGRTIAAPSIGRILALPVRLASVVRSIVRIARAERVDLVRANDPYLMGVMAWWVARSLRIPFCVSLHADYEKSFSLTPKRGMAAWLRRVAARLPGFVVPRADMLLPIREHMIDWLERVGGRRPAIRVIPHGIDMTPFAEPADLSARAELGIPDGAPVVSFVGRWSSENYALDVAEIVARVSADRPNAVFVLAGEGEAEAAVRQRLSAATGARIRMLAFQPYERVVAIRRMSAVSLCLMGGFSLIEACAAGSAVVAYDVEWHHELVQDGVTGFLIPEHDVARAAAAVTRLLDDPALAAAMGGQARRVAIERHERRATSAIKRACYAELLGHSAATVV